MLIDVESWPISSAQGLWIWATLRFPKIVGFIKISRSNQSTSPCEAYQRLQQEVENSEEPRSRPLNARRISWNDSNWKAQVHWWRFVGICSLYIPSSLFHIYRYQVGRLGCKVASKCPDASVCWDTRSAKDSIAPPDNVRKTCNLVKLSTQDG